MENNIVCSICHEALTDQLEAGEINNCRHRFCYPCISKWAQIENRCPCCKTRFSTITKKLVSTPTKLAALGANSPIPGTILAIENCADVNQRPVFEDPSFQEWIENLVCLVCGNAENEEELLLCDDCDGACHTYCAGLSAIPDGEWFCTACSARRAAAAQQRGRAQRREPQEQQQQQDEGVQRPSRRRRLMVIVSDDDESDDGSEEAVRVVEVRQRRLRQRRQHSDDSLDGFIVSESDEDEELSDEEQQPRGRRTHAQKKGRHAGRAVLDSDSDSELGEWDSDENELDQPGTNAAQERTLPGNGWRRVNRGPQRVPQQQQQQQQRSRGRRRATSANNGPSVISRPTSRSHSHSQQIGTGAAPTAGHRAVQSLTERWEELRAGTVTFDDVLGEGTSTGSGRQQQLQQTDQRRSRQSRARQTTTLKRTSEEEHDTVIDLCDSPEEDKKPTQQAEQKQSGRRALSPPLISLSSKLRAELTACRERGARLPPTTNLTVSGAGTTTAAAAAAAASTPGAVRSALWRMPNATTPGSSGSGQRMRTVRDVTMRADMARRTPINADGRSSPPPLHQRLAARAAAEWGTRNTAMPQQPQQQAQQPPSFSPWRQTHPHNIQQPQQAQQHRQFMPRPAEPPAALPLAQPQPPAVSSGHRTPPHMPPSDRHIPPFMRNNNPQFAHRGNIATTINSSHSNITNITHAPEGQHFQLRSPNYSASKLHPGQSTTGSNGPGSNPKQDAYNLVKDHVRVYFDDGVISKAQYKAVAQAATRTLYQSRGNSVRQASTEEVARLVDDALVAVIKGHVR